MYRLFSMTAVCCALAAPAFAQTENVQPNQRERPERKFVPDRAQRFERPEKPRFQAGREATQRRQASDDNRSDADSQRRGRPGREANQRNNTVRRHEAPRQSDLETHRRRGANRDADHSVQSRRDRPGRAPSFRERRWSDQDVNPQFRDHARKRASQQRQSRHLERDRRAPAPMRHRLRDSDQPQGHERQDRRFEGRRLQRSQAGFGHAPMRSDRLGTQRPGARERSHSHHQGPPQRRQRPRD